MATKDERPTLLSKVALFVRNPTKDWSELDTLDSVAPSGYDRAALKAAIERKRRNDFVRKREFDQLRKLRRSAAAGEVAQVRPSSFQTSSILTDPDGRAQTLEKIDQIEAQMSRQWWQGRQPPELPDSAQGGDSSRPSTQVASTQLPATNFPSTEPLDTGTSQDDFATTQSTQDEDGAPEHLPPPLDFDTLPVRHAVPAQPVLPTDPELEEAAIRFANGDDAGAQAVLLQALRSAPHAGAATAGSWWAALLAAYRCAADRGGFDAAVREFGDRFPAPVPVWEVDRAGLSGAQGAVPAAPAASAGEGLWSSPRRLGAEDMERLRQVLAQTPMPWSLDWSALVVVEAAAQPLLGALFSSLCTEAVQVRFAGGAALRRALQALTPAGESRHGLWALRLDALRVMQCVDEFESAALDYCVACGVEPPPWMEAACAFLDLDPPDALAPSDTMAPTAPMSIEPRGAPADAFLQGQLSGDATPVLAHLAEQALPGRVLVIDCAGLVRVDFAAAGSLLNWAAHQQAQGCTVEFCGVHRLVAAFFNVIGVHEHAHIQVRDW